MCVRNSCWFVAEGMIVVDDPVGPSTMGRLVVTNHNNIMSTVTNNTCSPMYRRLSACC